MYVRAWVQFPIPLSHTHEQNVTYTQWNNAMVLTLEEEILGRIL